MSSTLSVFKKTLHIEAKLKRYAFAPAPTETDNFTHSFKNIQFYLRRLKRYMTD